MGKQIIAKNIKTTAIYRFYSKLIYLKCNNLSYIEQLVSQIESKGGRVKIKENWAEIDIFWKKYIC